MSETMRVRTLRSGSSLDGRSSLKVQMMNSAFACEISPLVTAAEPITPEPNRSKEVRLPNKDDLNRLKEVKVLRPSEAGKKESSVYDGFGLLKVLRFACHVHLAHR